MALKEIILIFAVMLTVLVLTGTGYAMASPPAEEWNRTYEISGITSVESLQQTADSGYIIAGNTRSNVGRNSDINLLKTGPTGSDQWNRTFGRTFTYDCVKSVLQTLDGGYLIAGSTSACRDNCTDDVWLIKMSPQGQEQWNLTLGGTGEDKLGFVQQTDDSGYVLIGNTNSYGAGSFDIWFVKVDSNGNMQWDNTIGGIGRDKAYSVSQVPGGYIIAGYTNSYGANSSNCWLVKTDSEGNEQWNKTYDATEAYSATFIRQTTDNGFIITGGTWPHGVNHTDFFLLRTDSNGNEKWIKIFGGANHELFLSVFQTPDMGFIVGGKTLSFSFDDFLFIKTNTDGNMQWDRTFKGHGLDSFQQTPDGGYIIKGDFYAPSKTHLVKKTLIKTDSNGNEQWEIRIEGDKLNSVLQTGNGSYILVGTKDSKLLLVKLMAERPAPSAQFTYDPGYPGANQTITFDASASYGPYGNITYYQWDLGDGSYVNTTQRTVTHSYDGGDNYSVVLTVTDDEGEMDSITWEITVQQSAPLDKRWDQTFEGAGDDRVHSLENTSEDGNVLTDGEPVRTPDIPGFGAAVAVMGLLVWVGLVGRRRQ